MKKSLLFVFILPLFSFCGEIIVSNPFQQFFNQAYQANPSIPKGILEAVSYTQTRFAHLDGTQAESCIGFPKAYTAMGLIDDGKNYFRNNLLRVSELSGYSVADIKSSAQLAILAYAKAYSALQTQLNTGSKPEDQFPVLTALSELPLDSNVVNNFALNAHLYQVFWLLTQSELQDVYGFPDYKLNLQQLFAENYSVLSSSRVAIGNNEVENANGVAYKFNPATLSSDYAPALWNAAASCNSSSRNGTAISAITIHDVEGTYSGCISWFQNCNASVSAHYVLRSSDGQVTQMVLESGKAWHVGSENPYTIGLEHEGYNNNAAWYTTAMYTSSADLCRDICNSGYGINPLRCYNGPACTGTCTLGSCVKIKGHQHYPNQSHNDPGPYWNWYKFYTLINNSPTINTITSAGGTFYDSGGPSAAYTNDERDVILLQPAGATNLTVNFTQFDLETNWDYMYIYDGATVNSPLIARYTGTSGPGTITSTGSSLLLDFRSDCATVNPGWTANFTSNATPPPVNDNVAPTTLVSNPNVWETQNFQATFTDADNSGGSGLEKSFYQVLDFDGTEWRANNTRGFFSDNFDAAIHPEWTQKTGTWSISNMSLTQTDEVSGNTNIYASLTQNLSNRYLYHFSMKIDGTGTNRRAGFHFFCDAPDSSNRGNSYFAWFRVDNSKLQIYKVVNDVFGSPVLDVPMTVAAGTTYDYKIIYDRITGKIDVYQNNVIAGTWTDPSPYSNGNSVSFRSGNATIEVDELKIYRSRVSNSNVSVSVGVASTNDVRYQNTSPSTPACKIKTIVNDSAGNLSAINYTYVNIDWTAPSDIVTVNDGLGADESSTNLTNTLAANWTNSVDTNSAIARYWYSIGTSPCDTTVLGWTSNWGNTIVAVNGLNLQQGQLYYFNVKSEDGAGLFSNCVSSNGVLVDTVTTSASANELLSGLCIGPVPAQDYVNVKFRLKNKSDLKISLIDLDGKELGILSELQSAAGPKEYRIELSSLPAGIYFLRMLAGDEQFNRKLVIEKN
jgi:N-acetyl-anhydromuramyl-L-alanine amidase AmpD